MALVGLNPDIVLEICQKAFSFWNYQISQEQLILNNINQNITARVRHLESENHRLKLQQTCKIFESRMACVYGIGRLTILMFEFFSAIQGIFDGSASPLGTGHLILFRRSPFIL